MADSANSNDRIKSMLGTSRGTPSATAINSPALKNIASNSTHVVTGVSNINNTLLQLIKSWGG